LLRSKGELCKIPVGVLPLGKTNTLANTLFGLGDERSVEVNQMAKATMAVIKGHTQPFDALRIEALDVNI
jgi:acylglycerol kinase